MTKHTDRTIPRRSIEGFVDPTRRFGKMRRLWEHYCGFILRIEKLQKELDAVQRQLLKLDPSFFDAKHSLTGVSFPFWAGLKGARRFNPLVAARNAIILNAKGMKLKDICIRLDSNHMLVSPRWRRDFPEIKTWLNAYNHKLCRPRVERVISGVQSKSDLP